MGLNNVHKSGYNFILRVEACAIFFFGDEKYQNMTSHHFQKLQVPILISSLLTTLLQISEPYRTISAIEYLK